MNKFRFLVLACIALFAVWVFAQAGGTGAVTGTVTDPSGAVISGATVAIANVNTGVSRPAVTTGPTGAYTFSNLPPGIYDVKVAAPGFGPFTQRVDVTIGGNSTVNAAMKIAASGTTVEVLGAGGVQVNTVTQGLSDIVSSQQVTQLPSLNRNPYDLVATSSNVAEDPSNKFNGVGSVRGTGFNINGLRTASTDALLDGGENVDLFTTQVGQQIPLDAVQQFRVLTSDFDAQYGRASGGVVNVATKSGTNSWHGSLYEFNRLSKLTANTFDNVQHGVAKGHYTRNQFGGSFGGPIKKDKLFFFMAGEFVRTRSTTPQLLYVPDPALISAAAGNTQAFMNAFPLRKDIKLNSVLSVGQLSTFITPGARLSALAPTTPALDLYAVPVATDSGGGAPQNAFDDVARIDYNLSDKTQMFARYAYYDEKDFPGTINFSPYAGFDTGQQTRNHNSMLSMTHSFSPNFLSETKGVYNRLFLAQPLASQPVGPTLYMANASLISTLINGSAVALPGYNELTPGAAIPFGGPQNVAQFIQDFSWTHGNHQVKFGGSFIYTQDNRIFGAYEEGVELLSETAKFGPGFDNFLGGQVAEFQAAVFPQGKFPCRVDPFTGAVQQTPACTLTLPVSPPNFSRSNRYRDGNLYAQDTWKVMPRLNLTLGVRWEYYGPQHNVDPRLDSNFYPGSGATFPQQIANGQVLTVPNSPIGSLWRQHYRNFAPRVGFAYDVFGDGKTSLRGGYGIAYERNFGNVTFNVIQNPPNYAVLALINGIDVPAGTLPVTLANVGPLAGSGITKALPRTSLRAPDPNMPISYASTWNLSVEHQLATNTVISMDYSGSRGIRQYTLENINNVGFGAVYGGLPILNPDGTPGNCNVNFVPACTARLNNQYSSINARESNGDSWYNGLIVKFRTSNLKNTGVTLNANWTWSHAIDELSTTFSESPQAFNLGLLDPFQPSLDKGNADYDARHRVQVSAIWDVPVYKNQSGILGHILGGWETTPLFSFHTGNPYSVYDCTTAFVTCNRYIPSGPINLSANNNPVDQGQNLWTYNVLATPIAYTNPLVGFGDVPTCTNGVCSFPSGMTRRNIFAGPRFWNMDIGIYKNFKVTEKTTLQFRTEMFNAFNHHNFYVLGGTADVSSLVCSAGVAGCSPAAIAAGNPFVEAKKGGYGNSQDERRFVQFALRLTW
jgi:outer membrane receptor protein involved in Fe transport